MFSRGALLGCLGLLLGGQLASSACTDGAGETITSVYRLPTSFEASALEVNQTLDDAIEVAAEALTEILALDQTVVIQAQLDQVSDVPPILTFENTLGAINRMMYELWQPGYRLNLLSKTSDKVEVRDSATEAVVQMSKWSRDNVEYNINLYSIVAAFAQTEEAAALTGEKLRYLTESMNDYKRKGMALNETARAQLVAWEERLDVLTTEIDTAITNDVGTVEFTLEQLEGLPEQKLASLEYNATTDKYTAATAIASQYSAVSTYASNNETRLTMMLTDNQRAMEENGEPILEVLQLRQKIAALLGFSDWADYRISDKMAKSGKTAIEFIQNIDDRLDDVFLQEKKILLDLKRAHLNDTTVSELNRWDLGYYMNILMETEYQINQEEIAEYFEEEATLRGIFDIYEELFNIKITEDPDGPPGGSWAGDDIKFVHISEAGDDGAPIGGVYLDLHPRDGKYTHFAKFSLVKGYRMMDPATGTSTYQAPSCAIIGNWPVPVGNETVSLWKFSNVNTMFHEFGHALHDVLTCTEISSFSGTSVAWDFVEVPSQMLERWLDDINVIRRFARHYKNGNTMPEVLLESLIRAKTATVGHGYKGQVALGLADFTIHTYKSPEEIPPTPEALYRVTNLDFSAYYPLPEGTAKLASFGHLFGGYDAGYYGYAWADAIAADLASSFRASEEGFMDKEIGARFRKEILEVGGSRDPAESVRAFLGRDWNTDAFFEEMGLDASKQGSVSAGDEAAGDAASGKDGNDVSGKGTDEASSAPRASLLFSYFLGVAAIALWWS